MATRGRAKQSLELELPRVAVDHTNHNEIILPIGLKRLVKAECLHLDSAQHGPEAEEEKAVCEVASPERAHPARPTHGVRPSTVLLPPLDFIQAGA